MDYWSSIRGFCFLAFAISAMWLANFWLMPYFFVDESGTANAGSAGDMFGGLTALFSGLAFAGLITTLFMQRKELELQRRELSQTREVFQVQRFENTFFGLLKLLHDHVQSIDFSNNDFLQNKSNYLHDNKMSNGRNALELVGKKLPKHIMQTQKTDDLGNTLVVDGSYKTKCGLVREYEKLYNEVLESELGPYFRIVYSILRHIEKSKFSEILQKDIEAKQVYAKILRAHLNSSEVKLLMFNCASVHGKGLKGWLEKYSMLKHITRSDYEDYAALVNEYDISAFQFGKRKFNRKLDSD